MSTENAKTIQERLAAPFSPEAVHWRIGSTWERDGKTFTKPLAYLDARDVMDRLDEILGIDGWSSEISETASGRVICKLSIRIDGEWICKSDGAGSTGFEGEKGGISDALKRAAVNVGIGRYLYAVKTGPVEVETSGRSKFLPKTFRGSQYLPSPSRFSSKQMKARYYDGFKAAAADDDELKARELWDELDTDQQQEIWAAYGNESRVRSTIKKLLAMTANTEESA